MNCQDFNNLIKLSDFLHFNDIWLMFPQFPMYETNAIQLQFLVPLFWYISQWSSLICSIFCTRLYSKDVHCVLLIFQPITGQLCSQYYRNYNVIGWKIANRVWNEFSETNFLTWYFWTFFARMIAQFDTNCLCNKVIFGFEIIQYNSPLALTIDGSDRFD